MLALGYQDPGLDQLYYSLLKHSNGLFIHSNSLLWPSTGCFEPF